MQSTLREHHFFILILFALAIINVINKNVVKSGEMKKYVVTLFVVIGFCFYVKAQTVTFELNGKSLVKEVSVINRVITFDKTQSEISLNLDFMEGLVLIRDVIFNKGYVEVELKGEDIYQHSFLGIAFNISNDSTYEAIYFRPFQFRTHDLIRRSRGIQYVAMPKQTWQFLRKESPGRYEKEVTESPDPNDWFHTKIVVTDFRVQVYVNHSEKPCLDVDRLKLIPGSGLGFFVADQSGGSFRNLKVFQE